MVPEEYISIEGVAERLQLHVRTVRKYVRSGRLKAVRIGKQYRVSSADLAAFTGPPAAALPTEEVARRRHTEVTAVVQIDVISAEDAARVSEAVQTSSRGWHWGHSPLSIQSIYDRDRTRLKLILTGHLPGVSDLLNFTNLLAGTWLPK